MNDLIKFMERCGKQIQKGFVWLLALLGTLLARVQKAFASIQVNFGQHIQKRLQNVTSLLVKGFKSLVKVAFAPVVFAEIFLVKALGDTSDIKPEKWMASLAWMPTAEALEKIEYDDIGKLILLALKKIRNQDN